MNKKLQQLYKKLEGTTGIARDIIEQNIAELEAELERREQGSKSDNRHEARVYGGREAGKAVVRIDK